MLHKLKAARASTFNRAQRGLHPAAGKLIAGADQMCTSSGSKISRLLVHNKEAVFGRPTLLPNRPSTQDRSSVAKTVIRGDP